ncbi:GyrI-like domain-containing protein [Shimia thalassica]|uniref:GyrI-like domain-containing protein n=1 Tax=Shimia thalassica TaxID=1715693 RepID=UPI0026E3A7EE|nr:GyrI-like domain-containing protein [Shimia thalassica]MDO6484367.1 GyrI-like domain-containing protein [Shimia thalassica]
MEKLDFKKVDKAFYTGKAGVWDMLDVPAWSFIMMDGQGNPNGPSYARALAALYPVAYAIKFASKAVGNDYVVPPLEALWWAENPDAFTQNRRDEWQWTVMLRVPETVTRDAFERGQGAAAAKLEKKKQDVSAISELRLATLSEGCCLQTLHIGPYTDEAPVLANLHDRVMPDLGVTFHGLHHEIYLSDPRRTDPQKLKTLLRQPVQPITTG